MNRLEPNRNVYVGHRYVPLLVGEWDKSIQYEGLSIVTFKGASYTSKKMTPAGIDIENDEYWVLTGNYDAQVEYYRLDVQRVMDDMSELDDRLTNDLSNTRAYVDTNVEDLTIYVNDEVRKNKEYVDDEVAELTGYVNDEVTQTKEYVDDEFISVNEKLEQHMIMINGIKIPSSSLGVTADGTTDDKPAIQNIIDNYDGEIQLPRYQTIYLSEPLEVTNSNIHLIDFGYSVVNAPNGAVKINRPGKKKYEQKMKIMNAEILGENRSNIAIDVGTEIVWGSSLFLENVTARGYKIGLYGNSLYELETNNVKFYYCDIGMILHSLDSGNITDCSNIRNMYFDYNKYSVVIEDCVNMTFENITIEHSEYGIVLTGIENQSVLFNNTYFEMNTVANITCGAVNLTTLELRLHDVGDAGLAGVEFKQTRYKADGVGAPIFDARMPFTSKYIEIGENYTERTKSVSEFYGKNLIHVFPRYPRGHSNGTVFNDVKVTPFGETKVMEIEGRDFGNNLGITIEFDASDVISPSSLLFKCMLKIETSDNTSALQVITPQLTNDDYSVYYSDDHVVYKRIRTNRWEPFTRIIRMRKNTDNYDGKLRIILLLNKDYGGGAQNTGSLKISFTKPMVVDLTNVFGAGEEPTGTGLEEMVGSWFKYNEDNYGG